MDINVKNWRSSRHSSAEGSGVAKAVEEWEKHCPADLSKSTAEQLAKGRETAEALRVVLKTAKGKLKADAEIAKKATAAELVVTNLNKKATELEKSVKDSKDEKATKKLNKTLEETKKELVSAQKDKVTALNAVGADDQKMQDTKTLIADWDLQAEKYVRKTMKADEALKKILDAHTEKVKARLGKNQDVLEMLNMRTQAVESLRQGIEDRELAAEKWMSQMAAAVKDEDPVVIMRAHGAARELRETVEGMQKKAEADIAKALKDAKADHVVCSDLTKEPLTKSKHVKALETLDNQIRSKRDVLEQYEEKIGEATTAVKQLVARILDAGDRGVDGVEAVSQALARGFKRVVADINRMDGMMRAFGGGVDQAFNEIMNVQEGKGLTAEKVNESKKNAGDLLKQADGTYKLADAALKKMLANAKVTEDEITPNFASNAQGEAKSRLAQFREAKDELNKFAASLEKTKQKMLKSRTTLDSLA